MTNSRARSLRSSVRFYVLVVISCHLSYSSVPAHVHTRQKGKGSMGRNSRGQIVAHPAHLVEQPRASYSCRPPSPGRCCSARRPHSWNTHDPISIHPYKRDDKTHSCAGPCALALRVAMPAVVRLLAGQRLAVGSPEGRPRAQVVPGLLRDCVVRLSMRASWTGVSLGPVVRPPAGTNWSLGTDSSPCEGVRVET